MKTKKKTWNINFDENGGEYTGWLEIKAKKLERVGDRQLIADGVEIEIDEMITEIMEVKEADDDTK